MKLLVIRALSDVCKKLNVSTSIVEVTKTKGHGDLSSNFALKLASVLGVKSQEAAKKVIENINQEKYHIEKIEVAGLGFLNFYMKANTKNEIIREIIKEKGNFGKGNIKQYVNVEFVSANPTGFLHVGHARGAALGDSLCNIMSHAGVRVDREYYINDAGVQIHVLGNTAYLRYQELFGAKITLPENSYGGQEIIEVAEKIRDLVGDKYKDKKENETIIEYFSNVAKGMLLQTIKEHLKKFNVEIETYYSEESLYKEDKIVPSLKNLSNTYEKDGALWLKTTAFGDDKDRVLRKSDGTYTYFTPDLVYHNIKASRGYDKVINIWGADHSGYIKRMDVALEISGYKNKLEVIVVQLVKLIRDGVEVKMSKCRGTTYTLIDLIEEVGVDAARFLLTNRTPDSKMEFDINLATSKTNDNPVSYVQYAYARAYQLLKKANYKQPQDFSFKENSLNSMQEQEIIDMLWQFPELILKIAENHKVNLLNTYLILLAKEFHSFYNATHVIGASDEEEKLLLVNAVKHVLKIGLQFLGVSAPDKMSY